jgi:hypothetical protein
MAEVEKNADYPSKKEPQMRLLLTWVFDLFIYVVPAPVNSNLGIGKKVVKCLGHYIGEWENVG